MDQISKEKTSWKRIGNFEKEIIEKIDENEDGAETKTINKNVN